METGNLNVSHILFGVFRQYCGEGFTNGGEKYRVIQPVHLLSAIEMR